MFSDDNIKQRILQDKKNGKVVPWSKNKRLSRKLSFSYHRLAFDCSGLQQPDVSRMYKSNGEARRLVRKGFNVNECGSFLVFKKLESGRMKLVNANFCKDRLCPMCAWRRSLKVFRQVSKIMDVLENTTDYRYIFLTLTSRNVNALDLSGELDKLMAGFGKLSHRACKEFQVISNGWFRALEVTHDVEPVITKAMYYKKRKYYDKRGLKAGDANPNYDMYHPHFHVVIAVNKTYFRSRNYLSTRAWVALWRKCLGIDYDPIVDVRKVSKGDKYDGGLEIGYGKAIAEISKYSVKTGDYITQEREMMDKSVYTLDKALAYRRLIGYGGIFKELHKQLNLDDSHDGDLIHVGNDDTGIREDISLMVFKYDWHIGYSNYIQTKSEG